jgi:hypothetical protein
MNPQTIAITTTIVVCITELLIALRKMWSEIKNWADFIYGLVVVAFTLFVSEGLVLFLVLPRIVKLASGYTWDQYVVKQSIAWSSALIGSVIPFVWAIFMLPFIIHFLRTRQLESSRNESHSLTSSQGGGKS